MEDTPFQQVILEKLRIDIEQTLSMQGLHFARNHAEMSAYVDNAARALVVRLTTYLIAGPEEERVDVEEKWPTDWWQAFRERWFPHWWLRRWPVRYRTLSVHRRFKTRVCPHVNILNKQDHLGWLLGQGPEPSSYFGHDDYLDKRVDE